jgi:signal transduction histidine kinase
MALVLRNFLSNAVKFTPNGGTIGVNIGVTKADTYTDKRSDNSDSVGARAVDIHGRVMISVKDSGAGLTKENVKHLFQEGEL